MRKLSFMVVLAALGVPAHGTEIVRQSIDVRLVPGALEAVASLELAQAEDRPVFCLSSSIEVEAPFEVERETTCPAGLRAWSSSARESAENFVLSWTMPVELGDGVLVLRGEDGWYPRGREDASILQVNASSAIEGVSLVSNAAPDGSRALAFEEVYLLAGRWRTVRLSAGSDAIEFYSTSEGFEAPAFSVMAMLRIANAHLGALPGGRHLFVELPGSRTIDAQGLSAWPAALMLDDEDRELRLAMALLADWWGTGSRSEGSPGDWSVGARLYVATHYLLERGGPTTRTDWIDEFALVVRSGESERRDALRGAMVFHALRRLAGEKTFDETLRALARASSLSWPDVRALFAQTTRGRSDWVFDALVDAVDAPRLVLGRVQLDRRPGRFGVRATLESPGSDRLDVELRVTGEGGDTQRTNAALSGGSAQVVVRMQTQPLFVEVDPDALLLRELEEAELPPMLGLDGDSAPDLVLLGTGRGEAFLAAARRFARTRPVGRVLLDREAGAEDLGSARSVWIVGSPGEEMKKLLVSRLPLASGRLEWLGEAAVGPPSARVEGGDSWLLAGLGRWPGGGARVLL